MKEVQDISSQEVATIPESDNGALWQFLQVPLPFGFPKDYYPFAVTKNLQGDPIPLSQPAQKFLRGDKFLRSTQIFPERFSHQIVSFIHHIGFVTTDEQQTQEYVTRMNKSIQKNEPISFALCYSMQKFPILDDDIKCGKGPDLAELGFLHTLFSINEAVKAVYPPGIRFRLLNESRAFQQSAHMTSAYTDLEIDAFQAKLQDWITQLGWNTCIALDDLLDACQQKDAHYLSIVENKFLEYLPYYRQQTQQTHSKVKSEMRNVYLPALGLSPSIDEAKHIFTNGTTGVCLAGMLPLTEEKITTPEESLLVQLLSQGQVQAAYSSAFLDCRADIGGVYEEDEIPVTITHATGKIILPTVYKPAHKVGPSMGLDVLPTAAIGIMTKKGVALTPLLLGEKYPAQLVYSHEFGISYRRL